MKIIVVGAGWAGCAAAYQARKEGAQVVLFERTDMVLGTGLVGGIMRNNGRYTASEELIAMGGGKMIEITDQNNRHKNINFPGHEHAYLYDIAKTPVAVERALQNTGVVMKMQSRITAVHINGDTIHSVETSDGNITDGDVFIDTTGTAGPVNNCVKYGNGCAMCILRCPSFGGRVSLTQLCKIEEIIGKRVSGQNGAMSGSCKLYKDSLAPWIIDKLNSEGYASIKLLPELKEDHLDMKACQQYALKNYAENIILLDTGHAKMMTPYYPVEKLHRIEGLEYARFEDPYAGGHGNSMRFCAMAPRENSLKVKGVRNLFCAGEKAGLFVGHTEAIVTGTLAGHNAVKLAQGDRLFEVPRTTAIGEAIAYVNEEMATDSGLTKKYTFSGSVMFEHIKQKGLYLTDKDMIRDRIEAAGLTDIFACKTCLEV